VCDFHTLGVVFTCKIVIITRKVKFKKFTLIKSEFETSFRIDYDMLSVTLTRTRVIFTLNTKCDFGTKTVF
jgi:hypothetical protein